ncbi:hypothetical protein C3941_09590 [Kaistia algarum]|jgi:hypothetical protein|uniref:hypothetical protein n=1 Tax=Kaistia algarum TaxID=2083279 RepID=UPI000CE88442|nr:hypothetical protein [Kaistia algarum]MCX5512308.1 hypothetical protein [Kaistia algarum]PPE80399.1 hypothetical protein C3941_09590 [Kaistia algarum]
MTTKEHPQFRTRAQREQESDLRSKYGELGNPDLVEAIKQQKKAAPRPTQMQMSTVKPDSD